MITQEQLDDAILTITGHPDWAIVAEFIAREGIITRDSCADASSWEEVNQKKGFAEGLAFVLSLRQITETGIEERKNATL